MIARLLICLSLLLPASIASAQEQTLPDDLQALLVAASQSDNHEDIGDAIRLIALTQDKEVVFRAASTLGFAGAAINVLGNPVQFSSQDGVATADNTDQVTQSSETEDSSTEGIMRSPAAIISTLANGQSDLWTGKIRLGARFDTGNTERSDYSGGIEVERDLAGWGFEGNLNYAYSETDGNVGRDHLELDSRAERELGEHFTAFVNGDYDQDARSGFDWTAFTGAGIGYRVIESEETDFILRATPGIRFIKPVGMDRQDQAAFELAADYSTQLTETISFESKSDILLTEQSRADQRFTLSSALGELWALEFRVHYRYEFEPEPGFSNEDMRTDISITREF